MELFTPRVMENREFVELEEEDIQKLNRSEAVKFDRNPAMEAIMAQVTAESDRNGRWEEHWVTVDASGRRVYARVFSTAGHTVAVAADGKIIRETNFPAQNSNAAPS